MDLLRAIRITPVRNSKKPSFIHIIRKPSTVLLEFAAVNDVFVWRARPGHAIVVKDKKDIKVVNPRSHKVKLYWDSDPIDWTL